MDDKDLLQHISGLVSEEQALRSSPAGAEAEARTERIRRIEVALDQCWDLLRQRRARRDAGQDPDDAEVRDAGTVERYLN